MSIQASFATIESNYYMPKLFILIPVDKIRLNLIGKMRNS